MPMHSQSFLQPPSPVSPGDDQSPIESLNQLMHPVAFLTESEMQQDLDFFANAQFSYDAPPLYAQQHLNQQHLYHHDSQKTDIQNDDKWDLDDDDQLSVSVSGSNSGRPQKLSKDEKRKRNTAASARFRVKKKMREQALQQTALEMTEKSKRMEAHIKDLEREIKWLKSLIMEKNEGRLNSLLQERPTTTCADHDYH